MTSGGSERGRRSAAAIERAALELFAAASFATVTVEEIAAAAGVHERTFFRHFATKDDVLLALPKRSIMVLCDELAQRPVTEPLRVALRHAIFAAGEFLADDQDLRVLWAAAVVREPQISGPITTLMVDRLQGALAPRFRATIDDERLCRVAAGAIAGACGAAWAYWANSGEQVDQAAAIADSTDALWSSSIFAEVPPTEQERLGEENAALRLQIEELRLDLQMYRNAAANSLSP